MKKNSLITLGILIILIIVGVWVYLFVFKVPKNDDETFTDFGGVNDSEDVRATQENTKVDVGSTTSDGAPQALKQLTTKPVAGAGFTKTGIRYVEQGTGHIYHVDLITGAETLLNGTTIPGASEATFSRDGAYVAITTLAGEARKTIAGKVGEGEWKGVALPLGATEVTFMSATGTLNYFLKKDDGGTAYSYNMLKESNTELFTIPLRDVHILFGKNTYVYTTPTALQTGYLYQVEGGRLLYVEEGGFGLMGVLQRAGVITTKLQDDGLISFYHLAGGVVSQPIPLIPEKCVVGESKTFCTFPSNETSFTSFPDDWYKGMVSYSDILWDINTEFGEATVLSNFLLESGREIDVFKIGTDTENKRIYFINKNDNTLWMFDTTL